ncbi:MAG: tRNA pseudouridine(38-40) synthase TruA [Paracoccaceae bacterium]
MPRYALKIEYDGGPFHGWQRQRDLPSVQGAIEAALAKLEAVAPTLQGAGRTDTGVHAGGQVAHVDMTRQWPPERLAAALNAHLRPAPVAVLAAAQVDASFHARFSALCRHYQFRLFARRAPLTFAAGRMWQVRGPLDLAAMQAGAAHLLGCHDFTTFRSSICQAASPVKTLDRLDIAEFPHSGGVEYRFSLSARSFLHNQVRSFVGTLERVGSGNWQPDDVATALAARNRAACGPVSPPQGLYLMAVDYPEDPFN